MVFTVKYIIDVRSIFHLRVKVIILYIHIEEVFVHRSLLNQIYKVNGTVSSDPQTDDTGQSSFLEHRSE